MTIMNGKVAASLVENAADTSQKLNLIGRALVEICDSLDFMQQRIDFLANRELARAEREQNQHPPTG
jgi:hypothetical protein